MSARRRLDAVAIYGGKLSFLIPHEWVETEDGDDYLYHPPDADSGWLRVSLITVRVEDEAPTKRLENFFEDRQCVNKEARTGNLVHTFDKDSEEDGVSIHLYYWLVANAVPPDLIREAVFSYTILRSCIDQEETQQMVALVADLVSQADFQPSA
jgi:hypothetical protein